MKSIDESSFIGSESFENEAAIQIQECLHHCPKTVFQSAWKLFQQFEIGATRWTEKKEVLFALEVEHGIPVDWKTEYATRRQEIIALFDALDALTANAVKKGDKHRPEPPETILVSPSKKHWPFLKPTRCESCGQLTASRWRYVAMCMQCLHDSFDVVPDGMRNTALEKELVLDFVKTKRAYENSRGNT